MSRCYESHVPGAATEVQYDRGRDNLQSMLEKSEANRGTRAGSSAGPKEKEKESESRGCPVCDPTNRQLIEEARGKLAEHDLELRDPEKALARLLRKLDSTNDRFQVRP